MIKVSIIIATYNAAKTLTVALDSVINQSFQDWECIIVDGASTDKTIDIIKSYTKRDFRIHYISEPDKGIYDAFNKGWKMARGEWIHYLGSDDKLTENGIKDLIEVVNDEAVISGSAYIEIDGRLKMQCSHGFSGCHQAKLTRKSVIKELNGFNEGYRILADKDLYIRIEKKGYKAKNINSTIAYFSMDGVSQNLRYVFQKTKENTQIFKNNEITKYPKLLSIKLLIIYILHSIKRKIIKLISKLS